MTFETLEKANYQSKRIKLFTSTLNSMRDELEKMQEDSSKDNLILSIRLYLTGKQENLIIEEDELETIIEYIAQRNEKAKEKFEELR